MDLLNRNSTTNLQDENLDNGNIFTNHNSIVNFENTESLLHQSSADEQESTTNIKKTIQKKSGKNNNLKNNNAISNRRRNVRHKSLDLPNLQKLLQQNNNNVIDHDLRSLHGSQKIIIDYNILAFLENTNIDDDNTMENRMKHFIENLKTNYKSIQYIEYKMDNKLYCALDPLYFLPILFNKSCQRPLINNKTIQKNHETKMFKEMMQKVSDIHSKLIPKSLEEKQQATSSREQQVATVKYNSNFSKEDKLLCLYSIGNDFYLMCRKKQNFIDGQKNLEKKYDNCKLIKTWTNYKCNVKDIGKHIKKKIPQVKWNARTNIITNASSKSIDATEILDCLMDFIQ